MINFISLAHGQFVAIQWALEIVRCNNNQHVRINVNVSGIMDALRFLTVFMSEDICLNGYLGRWMGCVWAISFNIYCKQVYETSAGVESSRLLFLILLANNS